jgi:pyridoxamine 5'-phosphate oxidase
MTDPIDLFRELYERAAMTCAEPDAMVLSTVDPDGRPSGRYVLLKAADARGFVFYTNLGSRKARALEANPLASLCFYWPPEWQVRVEGRVELVADAEADAYFASRPRPFQIGAWASSQSDVLASRDLLNARVQQAEARFKDGLVARPPFWSGYRLVSDAIEFWTRDPARLHVRERYERTGSTWRVSTLYP